MRVLILECHYYQSNANYNKNMRFIDQFKREESYGIYEVSENVNEKENIKINTLFGSDLKFIEINKKDILREIKTENLNIFSYNAADNRIIYRNINDGVVIDVDNDEAAILYFEMMFK